MKPTLPVPDEVSAASTVDDRRPLRSRSILIFQRLARWLVALRVHPNTISVASIVFGFAAGAALALTDNADGRPWFFRTLLIVAAVCIQLRLICNMLDGMVAVEGKTRSAVGELYNEFPDRISDAATIIGAGYAAGGWVVGGFVAALLAVLTAYVRALGKAAGAGSEFCGPMAKPHRMALLTVVCVLAAVLPPALSPRVQISGTDYGLMALAVMLIGLGSIITCVRRLSRIAKTLRAGPLPGATS